MTELLLRDLDVAPDGLEARIAVSDRLRRLFAEIIAEGFPPPLGYGGAIDPGFGYSILVN